MAIGLPPVDVYSASDFVDFVVPVADSEMRFALGAASLQVQGVDLLTDADVRRAVQGSSTLSQAANALADAYERAGWRNVLVVPVDIPSQLTLVVYEAGLSQLRGAQPLQAYFEPFVGPAPISHTSFAVAARLATLHAARTGMEAGALYGRSMDEPDRVTMNLGDARTRDSGLDYQLRLGNEGNRFVGRSFASVDLSWAAPSSWRVGVGYSRAVPELGGVRGDPRYEAVSVFTDRVTRFGVVKLLTSYADYRYLGFGVPQISGPAEDPELQASALTAGLQLERFLYISPRWTWSAGAGVMHHEDGIEQVGTAASALERHSAAYLSSGGNWTALEIIGRPQALVDLQFQQSLADQFVNTVADTGFQVLSYRSGISVIPFGLGRLSLSYEGQQTDDALPQSAEWVLGGFDRLSAWLPGVAVGDRGTYTQLQYRIPLFVDGRHDLKLAALAERATSEYVGRSESFDTKLSSAGLGLSYRQGRNWMVEGRISTPIEEDAPAAFAIDDQRADFYLRAARAFDSP